MSTQSHTLPCGCWYSRAGFPQALCVEHYAAWDQPEAEVVVDDQIEVHPFPDDPTVLSVGVTRPDGTYVGVAVHDEALPAAKNQVRARSIALSKAARE